jgi:hypothetical protein
MSHVSSLSPPIAGCTRVASTPEDGAGEPAGPGAGPGPGAGRRVGNPDAEKLGAETEPEAAEEPDGPEEPEGPEEPDEPEESEEPEEPEDPEAEADADGANPAGGGAALSTGNVSPHSSQNPPICPVAPQASQVLGAAAGITYFLP